MITRFIGQLVCRFKGHLRGRRIQSLDNGATKRFECPRCLRTTTYKAK